MPTQKSLKIRVTTDSVTVSPVISPSAAIAPSGVHHNGVRRHAALGGVKRRFAAFCGAGKRGGLPGVRDERAVHDGLSEADGWTG